MVVLWSVISSCPLWFNVLPENEQRLSSKARGELGQGAGVVAVSDVAAVSQDAGGCLARPCGLRGEKPAQKVLQVPWAGDFHRAFSHCAQSNSGVA